jgi:hypothetical protein
MSVLLQLSTQGFTKYENHVLLCKLVRPMMMQQNEVDLGGETGDVAVEAANLLFYYLFEDYTGAVPVLSMYRKRVEAIVSFLT